MDFRLRLVIDSDLPDVQRLYDARPDVFRRLLGRPAEPDQAVGDFLGALRFQVFQFAVMLDETLLGLADCQLDDETEGLAHIGMVLLAPRSTTRRWPSWSCAWTERWLPQNDFGATRVETAVVAQAAEEIAFWQAQGYDFTGSGFRRDLGEYRPRFSIVQGPGALLSLSSDTSAICTPVVEW